MGGKTYTYYEFTQKQRQMERQIRATKREIEAIKSIGGDAQDLQNKLRGQMADYKSFSKAAGLKERDNRLRVESGSSTLKSTKAYQNAVNMKNAGALSNKTDPFGRKREKHAISYYEEIRNRRSDYVIKRISKNGGVSEKAAKNIYEHVFVEKHIFADGTERQFDPDYDMSESFRRILEGKNIKPHDITMLKHENLELNLMKKYNMVHEDAHSLAEQKYNYKKELDEFLERIGG
ncbi:phage minor capsid protein [Roseburia inulinivorans]|uniref:phage minor capsid protein n=1 Tax=Roseburia inulinivorans TaxID=360807 RepID=UPI0039F4B341